MNARVEQKTGRNIMARMKNATTSDRGAGSDVYFTTDWDDAMAGVLLDADNEMSRIEELVDELMMRNCAGKLILTTGARGEYLGTLVTNPATA
jgi:hypothetical protein